MYRPLKSFYLLIFHRSMKLCFGIFICLNNTVVCSNGEILISKVPTFSPIVYHNQQPRSVKIVLQNKVSNVEMLKLGFLVLSDNENVFVSIIVGGIVLKMESFCALFRLGNSRRRFGRNRFGPSCCHRKSTRDGYCFGREDRSSRRLHCR